MVEQFGFAMIKSFLVNTCAFTSGTISAMFGSILHADELSITTVPTAANCGAYCKEVFPPAEKIAMVGFCAMASSMLQT